MGIEDSTPDWDESDVYNPWEEDDLPTEYDPDYPYPDIEGTFHGTSVLGLGTCCVCRSSENTFNIVNLPYRTFIPGTGWGNVATGLPMDGAIAVVCDQCMQQDLSLESCQDVVYGYASEKQRKPFSEVIENGRFGVLGI